MATNNLASMIEHGRPPLPPRPRALRTSASELYVITNSRSAATSTSFASLPPAWTTTLTSRRAAMTGKPWQTIQIGIRTYVRN